MKLRDKMMLRLKEDGQTVVLRTSWEERERLMEIYPEVFYITEHYRNYPAVLMRLNTATPSLVDRLLRQAWLLLATKTLLARHGHAVMDEK